jgi:predicted DCC family thiol-disulfide oxidoreductase YuxK
MVPKQLTVFFDGGCPLCSREIRHYRRLTPLAPIVWVDVTREPQRIEAFDIRPVEAMAEFHVMDDRRHFAKGADGFLLLWSALPYYRRLSQLCRLIRFERPLRWFYWHFARWHFRRRCAGGACAINTH